jgi:threonine aldolase
MARRLADGVSEVPGVTVSYPVQSNAVFATLPRAVTEKLQLDHPFHLWNEVTGQARWMASFDTTEEDVDGFVQRLKELA